MIIFRLLRGDLECRGIRSSRRIWSGSGAWGFRGTNCPRHVAIIMDGNGRWARRRGRPRIDGHRRGIKSVRAAVEECRRLGLDQLTLYCLSVENWKRPERELKFLMRLLKAFVVKERTELIRQNIRLKMIGHREGLPADVLEEIDRTIEQTRDNDGMALCLAINYSGRSEIAAAARQMAIDAKQGRIDPHTVDEDAFSAYLATRGMSDPDLLIRTAGELRVSNFLLWQISYAEIWVTDVLWPDFRARELQQAFLAYAGRNRKFGGLPAVESGEDRGAPAWPVTFRRSGPPRDLRPDAARPRLLPA